MFMIWKTKQSEHNSHTNTSQIVIKEEQRTNFGLKTRIAKTQHETAEEAQILAKQKNQFENLQEWCSTLVL